MAATSETIHGGLGHVFKREDQRDVPKETYTPVRSPSARSMRRPVEFRDRVEVVDPCLLRANKYLPAWHQFTSLAQRSKPHVVGFWLIASRCRIDRRPAVRAESLQTDVSTIGGLSIFRRFAGQEHERSWTSGNDRSQRCTAHCLAVCAVAIMTSARTVTRRSRPFADMRSK